MGRPTSQLAEKLETLNPQQVSAVEQFVELLLARGRENALIQAAAAISAPAFEKIWSNPEDDAYDAL